MSHKDEYYEEKSATLLLLDGLCQALADGNRTEFVKAARDLKSRHPMNDDFLNTPYNILPSYTSSLKTITECLRDPVVLGWFTEELVLPPSIALDLARSTTGMDEQILNAVSLDKVMHETARVVQLKDGELFPVFEVFSTFRLFRFLIMKDPSCELLNKGLTQLLSNPEISCSNLHAEDIASLESHHEIMQAMQNKPVDHSPLSVIKHMDLRIQQIFEERERFFSRASKITKVPGALNPEPPKTVSLDRLHDLIKHGMTATANEIIRCGMLQLETYQQAQELLDKMPELTQKTFQGTFRHLLNQSPIRDKKADLRYLFSIAHERHFDLLMEPEHYQVAYYIGCFKGYLEDQSNHPTTLEWAIPFFDKALSSVPDNLIKMYRIKDFAPPAVANHCNRLKRLGLEDDLGM